MPNISTLISSVKSFKPEEFLNNNKVPVTIALLGLISGGLGVFLYKNTSMFEENTIEVIESPEQAQEANSEVVVEIAGFVEKPGVYKFASNSRVEDLMTACGGLSAEADRDWVEKYINRAAKLVDGQKIYIKSISEKQEAISDKQTSETTANNGGGYQSTSPVLGVENQGLTNINTATFTELDKLPGIGQVYGQKIIEQRPYSNVSELLSRGVLPKATYEKIKDLVTVY